jgi:hypothetical protein
MRVEEEAQLLPTMHCGAATGAGKNLDTRSGLLHAAEISVDSYHNTAASSRSTSVLQLWATITPVHVELVVKPPCGRRIDAGLPPLPENIPVATSWLLHKSDGAERAAETTGSCLDMSYRACQAPAQARRVRHEDTPAALPCPAMASSHAVLLPPPDRPA